MSAYGKKTENWRPKIRGRDDLECPIIADVDVLVLGGSQSGVAAGISASRALKSLGTNDPKVLVVEQNNYLGGQSVTNMVTQWEIHAFRLNARKWQIRGIGLEMVEKIVSMGGSDRLWEDLCKVNKKDVEKLHQSEQYAHVNDFLSTPWPFLGEDRHIEGEESLNVEAIKYGLQQMCKDEGVELLLDSRIVGPVASPYEPDGEYDPTKDGLVQLRASQPPEKLSYRVEGVIVEHFSGRGAILAKRTIDATANAVMPWWLEGKQGCTVNPAKKRGLTQSYVWIGGVDMKRFVPWAVAQPERVFKRYPRDPDQFKKHANTGRLIWCKSKGFGQPEEAFERANEQEDLDDLFQGGFTLVGFYLKWAGNHPNHGLFALDGPYYREDSLNARVWTNEHVKNLYGSWGLLKVFRHMPGCENAYIARTCERLGLRTTRIPHGLYTIVGEDLKTHKTHPDAVGVADWHDQSEEGEEGKWGYHVPLRALIPRSIEDLLFCSRSVSFGRGAMNAHRGIGTTIVCGQGAGVGAAVSLAQQLAPRFVDYEKVKELLLEQNVVMDIPHVE